MAFNIKTAEQFALLFAGLNRAHGHYEVRPDVHKAKQTGRAETVHAPVTPDMWLRHLNGTYGIGTVPIREDNNCVFGAIDIDKTDINHKELAAQIAAFKLPLIVCRSKSGGAHVYLFCREPISAEIVRGHLMEWAVALGYSGVEVFPKQVRLASENDVGNWINLPYFNAAKTDRYAVTATKQLNLSSFMRLVEKMAITVESLADVAVPEDKLLTDSFPGAPPCLQTLARTRGFGEGVRNIGLFNVGVYLRKLHGDGWEEHFDGFNQEFLDPPLGHKEVTQIVRNINKKVYQYTCKEPPIVGCCNRQICLTRKHGVGDAESDPGVVFGELLKIETNPPIWIWDVDGARIELTTAELKDQGRFHTRVIDILNKYPNNIPAKDWAKLVRERLEGVTVIDVPPDATEEGQMWLYLEGYCTNHAKAMTRDELLINRPWTEDDRTYFSSQDFHRFLIKQRFQCTMRQLWNWLKNRGAEHKFISIKGKGINVWHVEAFAGQTESFDVPDIEHKEEM